MLDEIIAMKTSKATDASIRRWLAEEHEFEVSRATFSRFKKKYNLIDKEKDSRHHLRVYWKEPSYCPRNRHYRPRGIADILARLYQAW